jgi:hypothetical protein
MILHIDSWSRVRRIRRFRRGLPATPERATSLARERAQGRVVSRDASPIEAPRGTAITVAVIAADRRGQGEVLDGREGRVCNERGRHGDGRGCADEKENGLERWHVDH